MRILIVDNNMDLACWGAHELRRFATASPDAVVTVRRAPHEDLPSRLEDFDKLIVSGSKASCLEKGSWVTALDRLIENALSRQMPFLGICYGHQALNRVVGGIQSLRASSTPEFGWTEIEVTRPSALLEGLPKTFFSFSSHFEEVGSLSSEMTNLARSEDCAVQACQYKELPIYGIQFHPEKNLEEAAKAFIERKIKRESDNFFNPKIGEIIFKNFIALGNA